MGKHRISPIVLIATLITLIILGGVAYTANQENQNVQEKTIVDTHQEDKARTYTAPDSSYTLMHSPDWYPHQQDNSRVIFTRSAKFKLPEFSEGYALGPQFHITAQPLAELGVTTIEQWVNKFISTLPDPAKEQGEVTINGHTMTRIVYPAATADGDEVVYFYTQSNRLLTITHYPYNPGSELTQSFEQALDTLSLTDGSN